MMRSTVIEFATHDEAMEYAASNGLSNYYGHYVDFGYVLVVGIV